MSRLFRDLTLVFVILFCLLLALPVIAQADDPTPQPPVIVTSTPDVRIVETPAPDAEVPAPADVSEDDLSTAFERFLTLINDISFLPWSAALVLLLTQVTKRFIPQLRPVVIALFFQVVIWALYAVANHYGFGQNVQDYVGAITKILEAILTVAPPMLASAAVTEVAFQKLQRRSVPGFKQAA